MRKLKLILFALLLTVVSVNGFSQQNDSISVVFPSMDYASPKQYIIEDIKVTGVNYLNEDIIIASTGITKGDTIYIPSDYISNILTQLWSQRYYSNVKAIVETEGDKAFIEFQLRERPRVSQWIVTGAKSGEIKEIQDRLKLKERTELSDFALKNSKDIIKRYLSEKGFRNATIAVTQRNDTTLKNFVQVTFNITKNPKVKIKEVIIEGNVALEAKKLKNSMKKTREKSLPNLFKSAKFNEKDFENDKLEMIDYMQSKGYRDGNILSDSVYNISESRIGIKMKVEEGQKYYYRNIDWVGNVKHSDETLNKLLGIQKGDVYDKKNMNSRLGLGAEGSKSAMEGEINVSTIYQNDGHLAFQLEPVESVVEGDSIDIQLRISEGKQFTINNIEIQGNDRTNDRVIRREMYIRPGELYDQSLLVHSIRQLAAMDHFDQEKISPDIQPVSDQLVDIGFVLEEKPSDQFQVSGGWGAGMFVASVGVTFNNVSMRKFFQKNAWKPYPSGDNQKLSISAQSNGTYYKALSFSFVEPWLGGKKPNALSSSFYLSSENDAYFITQKSDKRFLTIGASIGLSKRLAWPDPNFNLGFDLSYQLYDLKDWDYFLLKNGKTNTISLAVTLSRNSLDQPTYTRRGSELYIKGTVTPPWSAMNGKDYSKLSETEKYKWIEYYKINAMGKFFIPMLSSEKLVFMGRAEFGYLGSYNKHNPSPFEGFNMGGDGISGYNLYGVQNVGLRGYDNYALTPYANSGDQASVYVKYTAELRYPFILSPQSTAYGLIFAEAGNAYYSFKEFNPFNVKRALGVGIRVHLPIVGMFGIDWGYGFDRTPARANKRSGGQFHFSIGQQF